MSKEIRLFGWNIFTPSITGVKKARSSRAERFRVLEILPRMDIGHDVTLDGYLVPGVRVVERDDSGQWNVTLDGRYGIVAENIEELQRWIWLVANAMAVGAGYSCHGKNSQVGNPYKVQVMCIGTVERGPVTDTPAD